MRRIMAFNQVSADGYFSGPDGNLDWVVQDPEIGKSVAGNLSGPGTILFGRRTYEMFESFWPKALDDPKTAPNPHGGGRSAETRAMAVWINDATKVVFSRTRKDVTWRNSRLVRELDAREIEEMKRQPGADMIIFGSGSVASWLSQHGLIDEYQFVVCPVLLGNGRSLLSGLPKSVKVTLEEARPFPTGNVMLRYARAR